VLKGVDLNERIEYISDDDKGKDNPTIFILGNITHKDKLRLFTGAIDKAGAVDVSKLQDRCLDILKAGLKEIKNLNGKDYPTIDDVVVELISFKVVMELVGRILEYNFASDAEIKN
jgi:hypothetical protein